VALSFVLRDEARAGTREISATDCGDGARVERQPAFEIVENARIGIGAFEQFGERFTGRARPQAVEVADEVLQPRAGTEPVADRAFEEEREVAAAW
jgi:hypothetical protein